MNTTCRICRYKICRANKTYCAYEWDTLHVWMRHTTHVMTHSYVSQDVSHSQVTHMSHISHLSHWYEAGDRPHLWFIWLIWMRHVTHLNETCHTSDHVCLIHVSFIWVIWIRGVVWFIWLIWMRHVWFIWLIWMRHVWDIHTCYTSEWDISYVRPSVFNLNIHTNTWLHTHLTHT